MSLSSPSIELFMFRCIIIDCMLTPLGSFSVSGIYEHLLLHHMHRRNFSSSFLYLSVFLLKPQNGNTTAVFGG